MLVTLGLLRSTTWSSAQRSGGPVSIDYMGKVDTQGILRQNRHLGLVPDFLSMTAPTMARRSLPLVLSLPSAAPRARPSAALSLPSAAPCTQPLTALSLPAAAPCTQPLTALSLPAATQSPNPGSNWETRRFYNIGASPKPTLMESHLRTGVNA